MRYHLASGCFRCLSAVLGTFCIAASGALWAQTSNDFLKDRGRGWFWYEKKPDPPPEEVPVEPPPPVPLPVDKTKDTKKEEEKIPSFSVKWFQQNYENVVNEAIDNPTEENIDRYRLVNRVMLDKASNFTAKFTERAMLDPLLDEMNRYPIANAMRSDYIHGLLKNKEHYMRKLKEKAGIWVFLDETCLFCERQYPIVRRMAKKHDLFVTYITKDGRPIYDLKEEDEILPDVGQGSFLQIKVYPATVLVAPPDKYVVVSQGMLSEDIMVDRILMAAKYVGLISEEEYHQIDPNRAGLLSTNQISSMTDLKLTDPNFSQQIRDLLQKSSEQLKNARETRK